MDIKRTGAGGRAPKYSASPLSRTSSPTASVPDVEHQVQPSKSRYSLPKVILISALILVVLFALAMWLYRPSVSSPHTSGPKAIDAPNYATLLPKDSSIAELGGWKKLTPPNGDAFYVYTDSIDNISVNVSQQQLPKEFQGNTNSKVADLAKSYNATSKLEVAGTIVYIGMSAKGPQSVIFTKDNLLILIKSEKKIANTSWKRYISSLGTPNSTGEASY